MGETRIVHRLHPTERAAALVFLQRAETGRDRLTDCATSISGQREDEEEDDDDDVEARCVSVRPSVRPSSRARSSIPTQQRM